MSIIFKKIENGNIFTRDFSPLVRNSEIVFPTSEEIAVIYGPNGTGKTSLIKVLDGSQGTKVEFTFEETDYTNGSQIFHVINDQNNRNIISGETRDFFLGDNIRHEFELQDQVSSDRAALISAIISMLKNNFGISAANSPLLEFVDDQNLIAFIKDCANNRSKGDRYTTEELVALLASLEEKDVLEHDTEKLAFLQSDWVNRQSIIRHLEQLVDTELTPNNRVNELKKIPKPLGFLQNFIRTSASCVTMIISIGKLC